MESPIGDPLFDHLQPRSLENRNEILRATMDIEMSFTGRMDVIELNVFFMESSKELRNAVRLFEEGIFDAAFYAVRSAVELTRVVTYLSGFEMPTDNDKFDLWRSGGRFPMDSEVRKKLSEICAPYCEVREAVPEFFAKRDGNLKSVNKYIHRQGFKTLYTFNPAQCVRHAQRMDEMAGEFRSFIKGAVAEIIMLRLSIDPYPLLLRDPDVMYRMRDISMTKPLSDDVVDLFLTPQMVEAYRSTDFYRGEAVKFAQNEPLNQAAYNLHFLNMYSRTASEDVRRQFHLLTVSDRAVAMIFDMLPEATYIVADHGFNLYWADDFDIVRGLSTDSAWTDPRMGSFDYSNRPVGRGYATRVKIQDGDYEVHHQSPLSDDIIRSIETIDHA